MTERHFYLWRRIHRAPLELVAVVKDVTMAQAWFAKAPAGERRRWTTGPDYYV